MQNCYGAIVIGALCLSGCQEANNSQGPAPEIVGAWLVKIPDAPFPLHMFVFHSDGTVTGSARATFFDPSGRQVKGPVQVTMTGERVMP